MTKKKTTAEFIEEAKAIHGDRYDYSKVEYKNNSTKVQIICEKHDIFMQTPREHLDSCGCPVCGKNRLKKRVYGVGVNDLDIISHNGKHFNLYTTWRAMLQRCYDEKQRSKNPTYHKCSVCDSWHTLSNFASWYNDNYIDGWQLDKDIIRPNSNMYSSETCCFVPQDINVLFISSSKNKNGLPIGVLKSKYNSYYSVCSIKGKSIHLGTFRTIKEAYENTISFKKKKLLKIANCYYSEGKLPKYIYDILLEYEYPKYE